GPTAKAAMTASAARQRASILPPGMPAQESLRAAAHSMVRQSRTMFAAAQPQRAPTNQLVSLALGFDALWRLMPFFSDFAAQTSFRRCGGRSFPCLPWADRAIP